jgi:menaquinone reductase, molybdopterin-binding-like subunit
MAPEFTRRDLLRFCGGAAAGILVTPMPWKVMDDLAIWTQNPSRAPRLPRGEVTTRLTSCACCPAGCGVRARCVAGRPVALAGVPGHPASGGALCPLGFAAHQLPYHPLRRRSPVRRLGTGSGPAAQIPVSVQAVTAALASCVAAGRGRRSSADYVAILDPRPGRALSGLYRRFLSALPDGLYLVSPPPEDASLGAVRAILGGDPLPWGYDLERCRTILSFGAPVLEGWGGPVRLLRRRFCEPEGSRPRFLQVESRPSDTALLSDRWLAPIPGTEGILALGLAHVILQERLCEMETLRRSARDFERGDEGDYVARVRRFDPDRVSRITGVNREAIVETAREFARGGPSLALSGGHLGQDDAVAVAGLNFLAGSVGRKGGVLFRRPVPETADAALPALSPLSMEEVPDHSIRLLILDDSPGGSPVLREELERKLVPGGSVVASLSPYRAGHAAWADLGMPSPAWLEGYEETSAPPGSTVSLFGVSVPFMAAPAGALDRAELIHRLAAMTGISLPGRSSEDLVKERARAIFESGRGEVFGFREGERSPVAAAGSSEGLWKLLREGACWIGEEAREETPGSFRLLGDSPEAFDRLAARGDPSVSTARENALPLVVVPFGPAGWAGEEPVPSLASKLDRESGLKPPRGRAFVHPDTGREQGLKNGLEAWIETPARRIRVVTVFDDRVLPGIVHLSTGSSGSAAGRGEEARNAIAASLTDSGAEDPRRRFRARMREA